MNKYITLILKKKLVFLFELSPCHCNFLKGFPRICKPKTVLTPSLLSANVKALRTLTRKIKPLPVRSLLIQTCSGFEKLEKNQAE